MSWHTLALLSQRVRQNEMGSKEKLPIIVFFLFLVPKDFWITRLSNILAVRVPAQAYSRNTSCTLNLISAFLLLFLLKSSGWDKVLLSQISFINIVSLISCGTTEEYSIIYVIILASLCINKVVIVLRIARIWAMGLIAYTEVRL